MAKNTGKGYRQGAKDSTAMAKNTGKGYRQGAVDKRSQSYNPATDLWTKRDTSTGQFLDTKQNGDPFKGVRKENP